MHRVLSAVFLLAVPALAEEPVLRFSVIESWTMPLVLVEDGKPKAGLLYDLMISLAQQAGMSAQFVVLPRKRVQTAMETGQVDMRCYAAQSWLPNLSGDYIWSLPLMRQRDVLVARSGDAQAVDIGQLRDERIGTILGFMYRGLDERFASGALVRDDARNQSQVLRKLLAGRYRYAVSNDLTVNWLNLQLPADKQIQEVALIQDMNLGCYVRNDPALPVQRILRTLLRMKMSGEVDALVRKYKVVQAP
jgi:polar amino acid transport system substrate-binding protein